MNEANETKRLDARTLRAALREGGGPLSLGALRRERDWSPQELLKVAMLHPDQFSMTSTVEEGRQHPAIEAESELSDEAKKFVAAVRVAGRPGITGLKLFRLHKITTPRSQELAGEFPDLVSVEKRGNRVYFHWKPKLGAATNEPRNASHPLVPSEPLLVSNPEYGSEPGASSNPRHASEAAPAPAETQAEASGSPPGTFSDPPGVNTAAGGSETPINDSAGLSELQKQRDRLVELCKDGTRSSDWLSQFGYDMSLLVSLVHTFPGTFHSQVVNLSNTPAGAFLQISLRRPMSAEQTAISQPVKKNPQELEAEKHEAERRAEQAKHDRQYVDERAQRKAAIDQSAAIARANAEGGGLNFSEAELRQLSWKPRSPGMKQSRTSEFMTQGGTVRERVEP